ncbi:MAG TPA: helix-turn-helix domain-containing protein, partial [Tepidisphaeraceae bacterium]|nr:helix-turn-helix domain-containing protein [Tepidisphaeraceae bacterium]
MRHPSRYPLLHDKVQRARQDVRTLESYVAAGDVTVQPLLDEQRHNLRALEAALRDLAWLADPEAAKDVVPAFAPETGAAAVGRSLFSLRTIHDLSQEQMGERLEMSQGAVARLEGEEKQNYELATLAAYARAVDYIYLGSFVRPGRGFNDPASLSRLGVEVGHIKGMYRGREALALPRYLDLVRRRTAADVVTCYAPDPRRKLLDLVHYDGVTKERQLLGHVRSTDVVWRVLGQAPRFVVDAAADPLFHGSAFREREGVRSVCYLPFATPGGPGVIFLSYRHRVEAPSAAYWHLLKGIAPLTEFVMAGHESEAAAEGRGRPAPGVVHRPARAAAVAVVAAPVDADRGRRTGIADFIEALLIDRAAHDHRWSSKAVTGVLGRVAERLGKRDTVCFLYVLDGNHRVALRNQFPAATGDL